MSVCDLRSSSTSLSLSLSLYFSFMDKNLKWNCAIVCNPLALSSESVSQPCSGAEMHLPSPGGARPADNWANAQGNRREKRQTRQKREKRQKRENPTSRNLLPVLVVPERKNSRIGHGNYYRHLYSNQFNG